MSKVTTGASMSIDGYISGPGLSGFEYLFRWYGNGEVEIPMGNPELNVHATPQSAEHLRRLLDSTGVLVCSRRLYDQMGAWGGRHPMSVPVVVVSRDLPDDRPAEDENFVFVTEGIEAAIAKAKDLAGDKNVGVNGGTIASQCLDAGLLDEVHVDLVPVILGDGTPFFSSLGSAPVELEGPISVVQGDSVTHLAYRVVRQ